MHDCITLFVYRYTPKRGSYSTFENGVRPYCMQIHLGGNGMEYEFYNSEVVISTLYFAV